eukprot:CAMPEP_0119343478 /NCGR_PEP_ID=MMETSP1333-20130426/106468_1 /TAXON_ID=418940 /ORGANISM="Scyphosphaera apsteinii, Strain RCC1455" /LENGTH=275 /DNA_ID=CAMNT_0007355869 /DNA_START=745 /DNA_END=1572 /DNA_ORIENTATION=+
MNRWSTAIGPSTSLQVRVSTWFRRPAVMDKLVRNTRTLIVSINRGMLSYAFSDKTGNPALVAMLRQRGYMSPWAAARAILQSVLRPSLDRALDDPPATYPCAHVRQFRMGFTNNHMSTYLSCAAGGKQCEEWTASSARVSRASQVVKCNSSIRVRLFTDFFSLHVVGRDGTRDTKEDANVKQRAQIESLRLGAKPPNDFEVWLALATQCTDYWASFSLFSLTAAAAANVSDKRVRFTYYKNQKANASCYGWEGWYIDMASWQQRLPGKPIHNGFP